MYGMDHGGWMFGGGWVMILWWIVPIAIAVAVAALFYRRQGQGQREDEALETLRRRYAKGEIGAAEFDEARRNIGG